MIQDREVQYWDSYYSQEHYAVNQSSFAEFVLNYTKPRKTLVDLGCGNGRDSIFFAKNELIVTGIDSSKQAVSKLKKLSQINNISINAVEGDFVDFLKNYAFDYVYSRFTLHSIPEREEKILIKNAIRSLCKNGYFFVEARSVRDDICGLGECVGRNEYIYNGHYRRFIVMSEIITNFRESGFEIIFSEEDRGFAVYGNENPVCIRIVARNRVIHMPNSHKFSVGGDNPTAH